jgi:hypothetical protein
VDPDAIASPNSLFAKQAGQPIGALAQGRVRQRLARITNRLAIGRTARRAVHSVW